jgi:hypothetical protein
MSLSYGFADLRCEQRKLKRPRPPRDEIVLANLSTDSHITNCLKLDRL